MSKESYIGGDYIETTGGNNESFATGKVINASLEGNFYQDGKSQGVLNGMNKPAPFIEFDTEIDVYVEFEILSSYNGEFGFDWLKVDNSDSVIKVQKDDIANLEFVYDNSKQEYISLTSTPNLKNNLKKDYNRFPLKIPYYVPWLSLLHINQEIKLNMICSPIVAGNDITKSEISFKKNDFYEVTIDGLKNENIKYNPDVKPKEISIKCLKPTQKQCKSLNINRKYFYYAPKYEAEENKKIVELLKKQYVLTPFYGYRKMTVWLQKQSFLVNEKRVRKFMKKALWQTIY